MFGTRTARLLTELSIYVDVKSTIEIKWWHQYVESILFEERLKSRRKLRPFQLRMQEEIPSVPLSRFTAMACLPVESAWLPVCLPAQTACQLFRPPVGRLLAASVRGGWQLASKFDSEFHFREKAFTSREPERIPKENPSPSQITRHVPTNQTVVERAPISQKLGLRFLALTIVPLL